MKRLILAILIALGAAFPSKAVDILSDKLKLQHLGVDTYIPMSVHNDFRVSNNNVERLIIVVHGQSKNAQGAYDGIYDLVDKESGELNRTSIVSLQYLGEDEIDGDSNYDEYAFWEGTDWTKGSRAISTTDNYRQARLSSFAYVDQVIHLALQHLPNLETVVFVGHSSGGQLFHRYALGNSSHLKLIMRGIYVKYIVANPASYTYFDAERPKASNIYEFEVPSSSDCPLYDEFKHGLNGMRDIHYFSLWTKEDVINHYKHRNIVYMVGLQDILANGDCEENKQGATRLDRARSYYAYLQQYYTDFDITRTQELVEVPGVEHSAGQMYRSDEAYEQILCLPVRATIQIDDQWEYNESAYFKATSKVEMNPGFIAHEGSYFTAEVETCSLTGTGPLPPGPAPMQRTEEHMSLTTMDWSVFPNPTANGSFQIQLPASEEEGVIKVYDISGKIQETINYTGQVEFPEVTGLSPGIYVVIYQGSTGVYEKKVQVLE